MKVRQDAWTEEDDLLLAETVLRHVREGSTQLNAFEEVGDKLDRTSAACGFRWNAVVRHNYEKALQLSKKQRKQRQRILGKEQSGKKKLLYNPPTPTIDDIQPVSITIPEKLEENQVFQYEMSSMFENPVSTPSTITLDMVISFLQNLDHSNLQLDLLKSENERLKLENRELKKRKEELEHMVKDMEKNSGVIQEDYETLMKIMNRARKLVLFDEEDRSATKFKMDRNGNLEKLAE